MRHWMALGVAAMIASLSIAGAADYGGASPPERRERPNPLAKIVPPGLFSDTPVACDDPRVLKRIAERFAWAEKRTWRRGFVIDLIEDPVQRYTVLNGPSIIRHRHCKATALMTNDKRYPIFYIVEDEMGFASIGDGVTFCVQGLDRWHIYDRACRTMK